MTSTIGFKRATFFEFDKDDKVVDNYVVEGKSNAGGTVEASISGLSAEATKVYASNVPYFISQKGTGSVELSLSVLDVPETVLNSVLGRKENEDGITLVGEHTESPYVGVLLEANALSGEPVFFALLKGKFRLDEQSMETNEDEVSEPAPDELEAEFVADASGNIYATAKGENKRSLMEELFNKVAVDSNAPGGDTGEETP